MKNSKLIVYAAVHSLGIFLYTARQKISGRL